MAMKFPQSTRTAASRAFGVVAVALMTVLTSTIVPGEVRAQDAEFTQFYANPVFMNPAFAGSARCPRFVMQYRNQWPAMSGNYVTPEFEAELEMRLSDSINQLTEDGHEVLLLQAVPQFPEWSPFNCTVWDATSDPNGCGVAVPSTTMDDRQVTALRIFTQVADKTGVQLIDFRPFLLEGANFTTNRENTWTYRDMFHISVGESQRLAPQMQSALVAGNQVS